MEQLNRTVLEELILTGFAGGPTLHIAMFVVLLLVYVFTVAGNMFIIVIICTDYHLHSPMYFFLLCLSFTEIWCISTVVCKLLVVLIINKTAVSKAECFVQSYFYFFTASTDFLLLGVMSVDRYIAVCYPLQYTTVMRKSTCIKLVAGCLVISCVCLLYPTMAISSAPFCGRVMNHFFCDSAALMKLICIDVASLKLFAIMISVIILLGPLVITVISYLFIVVTIIRIPSSTGQKKTFSTCMSHLTMVSLVFGSAIFIEIRPSTHYSIERDKAVNLISTVLSPLLNPFIYTLRNKAVKDSIRNAIRKRNNV